MSGRRRGRGNWFEKWKNKLLNEKKKSIRENNNNKGSIKQRWCKPKILFQNAVFK